MPITFQTNLFTLELNSCYIEPGFSHIVLMVTQQAAKQVSPPWFSMSKDPTNMSQSIPQVISVSEDSCLSRISSNLFIFIRSGPHFPKHNDYSPFVSGPCFLENSLRRFTHCVYLSSRQICFLYIVSVLIALSSRSSRRSWMTSGSRTGRFSSCNLTDIPHLYHFFKC